MRGHAGDDRDVTVTGGVLTERCAELAAIADPAAHDQVVQPQERPCFTGDRHDAVLHRDIDVLAVPGLPRLSDGTEDPDHCVLRTQSMRELQIRRRCDRRTIRVTGGIGQAAGGPGDQVVAVPPRGGARCDQTASRCTPPATGGASRRHNPWTASARSTPPTSTTSPVWASSLHQACHLRPSPTERVPADMYASQCSRKPSSAFVAVVDPGDVGTEACEQSRGVAAAVVGEIDDAKTGQRSPAHTSTPAQSGSGMMWRTQST